MAKPIIKQMTPFDATVGTFVSFIWTGALARNNRMIIYDADTMRVIYDHTYNDAFYSLTHEIPARLDGLKNGKKYAVTIQVMGQSESDSHSFYPISDVSDKYYFWCSATPTFKLKGMQYDDPVLVESSTLLVELEYSHPNGVAIDTYQFFLYNSVHELIDSSDVFKGSSSAFRYTYRTLDSNSIYYLRATGSTVQGVAMDTRVELDGQEYKDYAISVKYEEPSLYAMFYAEPNPIIGTVDYYTNIINIESDRPSTDYIFDNGFIDLTNYPYSVRYSDNFTIPKNFTISLKMKHAHKTCDILKGETNGKTAWLLQAIYDEDQEMLRFKLTAYGPTTNYIIYSEPLDYTAYDIVTLHIRRVNGIYGLYPFIIPSDIEVIKKQWFYSPRGSSYYTFSGDIPKTRSFFVSSSEGEDFAFIDDNENAEHERQVYFGDKRISNDEYVFCTRDTGKIEHMKTWFVKNKE